MPSFCPSCKLTFEDKDLASGLADATCPRCNGPLQPVKSNVLSPQPPKRRARSVTPTAPAGGEVVPRSMPKFTDSLTPTAPGGGGALITESELEDSGVVHQDEPTVPGGAADAPPPGPVFMQDEPTMPRAPIPPARPQRRDKDTPTVPATTTPPAEEASPPPEPDLSPASVESPMGDPTVAPAGIVPPAALGGPQSPDLVPPGMASADGRRNTGLSDVFAPVGAFDPSSGAVIDTGPVDKPAIGGEPDESRQEPKQATGAGSPGERLLEFDDGSSVTGGNLELDLDRSGPDPGAVQSRPGHGGGPVMTTGQIPKARPAARPEAPMGTRPMATSELKAIRQGLPGWARLLTLLVALGVVAIVALELVSAEEDVATDSPEAAALDTLADVTAETARAERLLADLEREREEAKKSRRKASPRKAKPKSRKAGRAAKARPAEDFDDEEDEEDEEEEEDHESRRTQALRQYKEGNEQLKKRAFASAVKAFRAALRADPSFAYAHRGLGVAYASMKEPKKAIQQYRLYLKKAPNAPDASQVRKILKQAESK